LTEIVLSAEKFEYFLIILLNLHSNFNRIGNQSKLKLDLNENPIVVKALQYLMQKKFWVLKRELECKLWTSCNITLEFKKVSSSVVSKLSKWCFGKHYNNWEY